MSHLLSGKRILVASHRGMVGGAPRKQVDMTELKELGWDRTVTSKQALNTHISLNLRTLV